MTDIEVTVRGIVDRSDVNTVTKRIVRREYCKLRGLTGLSKVEKKSINAVLDKIVLELAQKLQSVPDLFVSHGGCETVVKDKTNGDVTTHSTGDPQITGNQNKLSSKLESSGGSESKVRDKKLQCFSFDSRNLDSGVVSSVAKQKNFVLAHPPPRSPTLKIAQRGAVRNQTRFKRLSSSDVLAAVLDDSHSDSGISDFCETPQKKTFSGGTLSQSPTNAELRARITADLSKTSNLACSEVIVVDSSESDSNVISNKFLSSRQGSHNPSPLGNALFSTSQREGSKSGKNIQNIFSNLCSRESAAMSPRDTMKNESRSPYSSEDNTEKRTKVSVRDINSDGRSSSLIHRLAVNIGPEVTRTPGLFKWKEKVASMGCSRRRRKLFVIGSSSDSEEDVICDRLRKNIIGDHLCPSPSSDSMLEGKTDEEYVTANQKRGIHHDNVDSDIKTDTESDCEPDSGEMKSSDTSFCQMKKGNRLKMTQKFVLSGSDSKHEHDGHQYNLPHKYKKYGRDKKVVIRIVNKNCDSVQEIKSVVVSGLDILENLENRGLKKLNTNLENRGLKKLNTESEKVKKQEKTELVSEHKRPGKKRRKQSDEFGESSCSDSDLADENKRCPKRINCGHGVFQEETLKKQDLHLSDAFDENDDLPLSFIKSCQDTNSDAKVGLERWDEKQFVTLSNTEKSVCPEEVFRDFQENALKRLKSSVRGHKKDIQRGLNCSKIKNTNHIGSNPGCVKTNPASLVKSEGALFSARKENSHHIKDLFATCSSGGSADDDCDGKHTPASSIFMPQEESDSDRTSSSLSDVSSLISPKECTNGKNLAPKSEKSADSSELAKLRAICREIGLVLRNSKELVGCTTDEDKVSRIKELLKAKGMKGKPSLLKAEKLNLLREVKELQSPKVSSLSEEKAHHRRHGKGNVSLLQKLNSSEISRGNPQSLFSDLRDVITIDD